MMTRAEMVVNICVLPLVACSSFVLTKVYALWSCTLHDLKTLPE